jgi:hypothetical protein
MGNAVPSCTSVNQIDTNEDRGVTLTSAIVSFANTVVNKKSRPSDGPHFDQYENTGYDLTSIVKNRAQLSYQTPTEERFLKPPEGSEDDGRKDRPAGSIQLLDPVQVAHALLEQAEEIARREAIYRQQNLLDELENLLQEGDDDDDDDDDEDDDDDSSSSFSSTTRSSSVGTASSSEELERDLDELDCDEGHFNDDDSRDVFSNLTEATTTDLDSRHDGGRSLATRTVLTTGTAATQQAKNLGPASARKRHVHQQKEHRSPRNHGGQAGWSEQRETDDEDMASAAAALVVAPNRKANMLDRAGVFAATQLLQSQIHSTMSVSARKALGKSYDRSAERYRHLQATSFSTKSPRTRTCGVTTSTLIPWNECSPSTLLRRQRDYPTTTREEAQVQDRVQRHLSALYLKLPSRCAAYIKHYPQLKRLLPANPVSRAIVLVGPIMDGPESPSQLDDSFPQMHDLHQPFLPNGDSPSEDFDVLAALSSSSTAPAIQLLSTSTSSAVSFRNENVGKSFATDLPLYKEGTHASKVTVGFGTLSGPSSSPIRMWMTDQVFLDLALTGSLGWVSGKDRLKPPTYLTKQQISDSKLSPPIPPNRHLVLLNRRSFVPLVVCRAETGKKERGGGPPVVGVYATKRRFSGQDPAATTRQWGLDWTSSGDEMLKDPEISPWPISNTSDSPSLPLYWWAKIEVAGSYPNRVRYLVFMARESTKKNEQVDFEEYASYLAIHESFSSPEVLVLGRTDKKPDTKMSACAIVSLCHDGKRDSECACDDEDDIRTRLSVSNGTDPALMMCLAAVVDESMEKSLRLQSRGLAEAVYKRNQKSI